MSENPPCLVSGVREEGKALQRHQVPLNTALTCHYVLSVLQLVCVFLHSPPHPSGPLVAAEGGRIDKPWLAPEASFEGESTVEGTARVSCTSGSADSRNPSDPWRMAFFPIKIFGSFDVKTQY